MRSEMEGTKKSLLAAAGELFAKHGVDGVGIRAIAEKAGANQGAINYHFRSKEHLYGEVLQYAVSELQFGRLKEYLSDCQ